MKEYTPHEWLMIDVANKMDHDKELYETRIQWVKDNYETLESFKPEKNTSYQKAVLALRDCDMDIPIGHLVELDAIASGIAILSVLTRCVRGMVSTAVIADGTRPDPYTMLTEKLKSDVIRADAKASLMQYFYGGNSTVKAVFGLQIEDFYNTAQMIAPRAYITRDRLINAWQADVKAHLYIMPNHSIINLRVWEQKTTKITVPNLDNRNFSFISNINKGCKSGLSLVANITHSCDAFIVQEMGARCNYNKDEVLAKKALIESVTGTDVVINDRTQFPSMDVLPMIDESNIRRYRVNYLAQLLEVIDRVLEYPPFPVLFNHDAFKCHANNVEVMRRNYNRINWDLYNSELLNSIFNQITGEILPVETHDPAVAELILESEYALN